MSPATEEAIHKLITVTLSMQADLAIVKARQEEFTHRLLGNGQPGEIANIKDDVENLKLWKASESGAHRENKKWTAIVATVISAALTSALEFFFHRSR